MVIVTTTQELYCFIRKDSFVQLLCLQNKKLYNNYERGTWKEFGWKQYCLGRMPSSGMWRHLLTLVLRWQIFLPWWWRRYVPPKRRFTQDLHGATSQKTAFFIVAPVKPSDLTVLCRLEASVFIRILESNCCIKTWWSVDIRLIIRETLLDFT
jgi:hypothetical protein